MPRRCDTGCKVALPRMRIPSDASKFEHKTSQKLRKYARQYISAPSNFEQKRSKALLVKIKVRFDPGILYFCNNTCGQLHPFVRSTRFPINFAIPFASSTFFKISKYNVPYKHLLHVKQRRKLSETHPDSLTKCSLLRTFSRSTSIF